MAGHVPKDHDFSVLLLIRTRCPDTSSKATLWMKALHEGALRVSNFLAMQKTHLSEFKFSILIMRVAILCGENKAGPVSYSASGTRFSGELRTKCLKGTRHRKIGGRWKKKELGRPVGQGRPR